MEVLKSNRYQGPTDFRATRPYQVKPVIVGGRYEGKKLIAYVSDDGREWDPTTYDRLYTAPKGKLKGKGYKGKNPDGRKVY